jgi:hypothetical protein
MLGLGGEIVRRMRAPHARRFAGGVDEMIPLERRQVRANGIVGDALCPSQSVHRIDPPPDQRKDPGPGFPEQPGHRWGFCHLHESIID